MKRVCVIGSLNMDMVLNMSKLPKQGETLMVNSLKKVNGGKGGNQACAASRLGCHVTMIGCIGNDDLGQILLGGLQADNIDTKYIKTTNEPSGMAMITVDPTGNNTIAVIPGANQQVNVEQVLQARDAITEADVIVSQFETPLDATIQAFKIAKEGNGITLLNPAPFTEVPQELLEYTDIIIPNETEAFDLTGVKVEDTQSAKSATTHLFNQGVKYAIITLGDKGAVLINKQSCQLVEAFKVKAIDTTAAGDSFIGAIASKIDRGIMDDFEKMEEIVRYGNRVSSITVTKKGAQSSLPTVDEVNSSSKEVTG